MFLIKSLKYFKTMYKCKEAQVGEGKESKIDSSVYRNRDKIIYLSLMYVFLTVNPKMILHFAHTRLELNNIALLQDNTFMYKNSLISDRNTFERQELECGHSGYYFQWV